MVREGKVIRSRTDYILRTDCCLFWNVSVWDPRHNTDHYMVLVCLHSAPEREHTKYLTGRKQLPLRPPSSPHAGGRDLRGPTEGRAKTASTGDE